MQHKEKPQSCQILITTAPRRAEEKSLKAVLLCPRMIETRKVDGEKILQPYDVGQAGQSVRLR